MRFTISICLLLLLAASSLFAQTTKQPPRAAVEKNTGFVSEEGGFKINFPSKPARTTAPIDTAFGKAEYISYNLPTTLAYYSIGFMDFPSVIKDQNELRTRYDAIKAKLLENPQVKMIRETEIFHGENLGREFVYETDIAAFTVRCFIVEQRFFQLTTGTRGKFVNSSAKVNSYNKKIVENFLNSFTVTKIPAPAAAVVELPENFGVKIEDQVFRSEHFKVSMEIPAGWLITEQEENEIIKELVKDEAQRELPKSRNAINLSLQNSRILMMLRNPVVEDGRHAAVMGIVAEKVAFPTFLPSAMTDDFPKVFLSPDETVLKTTTLEKIGGVEFAWLEIFDREKNVKKRLFIANRGGMAFEIVLLYEKQQDLETMLKALRSLKFEQPTIVNK